MPLVGPDIKTFSDAEQRHAPVENIGVAIGTCGTVPYVHLQLEMAKRFFGPGGIPILVVNDGKSERYDAKGLASLCEDYGVEFFAGEYLGHSIGDIRVFQQALKWAATRNIDIVVKLSRRFVPLFPSWRRELLTLASTHLEVACFTRRMADRSDGMFRTDCIALRVRKYQNAKTERLIEESKTRSPHNLNVEPFMLSLANMNGGWAMWDLIGHTSSRPWKKSMQWRGLLPCHYGDLSRELGLDYTDKDFESSPTLSHDEFVKPIDQPIPEAGRKVVNMGRGPDPEEISAETSFAYLCRRIGDINQHLPVLRLLASECESVTEFGLREGYSSTAFLVAEPKRFTTYDIDLRLDAVSRLKNICNGTQFEAIEADTLKLDAIEETDLLFIDTMHTYKQMKIELRQHNRVNKYIVLHDTETFGAKGEDGKEPGIMAAVDEFLEANEKSWKRKFHLPNNNGLTVLERQHG